MTQTVSSPPVIEHFVAILPVARSRLKLYLHLDEPAPRQPACYKQTLIRRTNPLHVIRPLKIALEEHQIFPHLHMVVVHICTWDKVIKYSFL